MRRQLLFCVESNKKAHTDTVYINSTINRFYTNDRKVVYSLSYDDEHKYGGYSDKYIGIPDINDFPEVPVYLSAGSEKYMKGISNENLSLDKVVSVPEGSSTLKIGL